MIESIKVKECGPIESIEWNDLSRINLIIGRNSTGKTQLLKLMYASLKALEGRKGHEPRSLSELLFEKLYWTFQLKKIGDLVRKSSENPLSFSMIMGDQEFSFSFGKDTEKKITDVRGDLKRNANSIFFPAKEVLSLFHVILKTREEDKIFGFDDTYYDLVKALQFQPKQGKNYEAFALSREKLEELFSGKVKYDEKNNQWYFKQGNRKFSIHQTAEGIKKIAMLDTLLGNRYLKTESVIFIDEPESALHPAAISNFMEIIHLLSQTGIQFFIATHSYFVIKKLYLIAQRYDQSIPVLSLGEAEENFMSDLNEEMPKNPIVNESIALYEEEIDIAWPK